MKRFPTSDQAYAIETSFEVLNKNLFNGELTKPMITLQRNPQMTGGYFCPLKWQDEEGSFVHEIAFNANNISELDPVEFWCTLAHELCHQAQFEMGKHYNNEGDHNEEWVELMQMIGLEPVYVEPGNLKLVDHKLIPGGQLERVIVEEMPDEAILPYSTDNMPVPSQVQVKAVAINPHEGKTNYVCPVCGLDALALPGRRFACVDDGAFMIEAVMKKE